jgi:hypothetical protein
VQKRAAASTDEEDMKFRQARGFIFLLFFLLITMLAPLGCRYTPPILGNENHSVLLVTDPGYFGSLLKWASDLLELTPCHYELKGWGDDNRLYYSASCYLQPVRLFAFDPTTSTSQKATLPPTLIHDPFPTREIIDLVRAPGVRPKSKEPFTRHIYLPDTGLRSQGGAYRAIITQRLYSVYDIVVLVEDNLRP